MKNALIGASALIVVAIPLSAETSSWQFQRDTNLNGQIDLPISTTSLIELDILSRNFISRLDATTELDLLQGSIEERSNLATGTGSIERISFTVSEDGVTTKYLGHGDYYVGFIGTWYGANGESGDFSLNRSNEIVSESLIPALSSNISSSPIVVSASSSHWNQNLAPWKAFNQNWSSWTLGQCFEGKSGWIKVDFGEQKTVTSYTVRSRDDAPTAGFKRFTFEGSNDDVNWTSIHVPEDQVNWSSGEVRQFDVPTSIYRYFRWNVTSGNGYTLTCTQELGIFGR